MALPNFCIKSFIYLKLLGNQRWMDAFRHQGLQIGFVLILLY
jgi:hypothetical protein